MAQSHVSPCGPHKLMAAVILVALVMPWQSTCTSIVSDFKSCVEVSISHSGLPSIIHYNGLRLTESRIT